MQHWRLVADERVSRSPKGLNDFDEDCRMLNRRDLLGGAGALAGVAATGSVAAAKENRAPTFETESHFIGGKSMSGNIIDFRVRPPFRSFRSAFHATKDPTKTDDELMESFLAEMDAAGISLGIAEGRTVKTVNARGTNIVGGNVSNDDVAALVKRYPGHFIGFGSVDVTNPTEALQEIARCADLGFKGIAFYNPVQSPALYDDDSALMPIYEECAKRGFVASITSSVMVGPDMSYSMPVHIQRVGLTFPELKIVVPHACWPWTTQIIGVLLQGVLFNASQVYIIPDFYLSQVGLPGREDYIAVAEDAGNFGLGQRILFASSYPALEMEASVKVIQNTKFSKPAVYAALFRENAKRVLGL